MKILQAGQVATASDMNLNFESGSWNFTYDSSGRVQTATDVATGEVTTITYNSDDTVNTITDGTNTWTFNYNSDGTLASIVRTP